MSDLTIPTEGKTLCVFLHLIWSILMNFGSEVGVKGPTEHHAGILIISSCPPPLGIESFVFCFNSFITTSERF